MSFCSIPAGLFKWHLARWPSLSLSEGLNSVPLLHQKHVLCTAKRRLYLYKFFSLCTFCLWFVCGLFVQKASREKGPGGGTQWQPLWTKLRTKIILLGTRQQRIFLTMLRSKLESQRTWRIIQKTGLVFFPKPFHFQWQIGCTDRISWAIVFWCGRQSFFAHRTRKAC